MIPHSRVEPVVLLLLGMPAALAGQGFTVGMNGLLGEPNRTQYSAGYLTPRLGPFQASLGGAVINGDDGRRFGGQIELDFFRGAPGRWYGVASIGAGLAGDDAESPWFAWSAGVGYRVFSVGQSDLGLEIRYHRFADPDRSLSLGARLAVPFGGKKDSPPPSLPSPPADGGPLASDSTVPVAGGRPPLATVAPSASASALRQAIVATATDVMGAPYLWGGSAGNGFDCSGLIQYAYREHGMVLPRRSVDQANAGQPVSRELDRLLPGDVLTFSERPGGSVTHVGMYLGDRRFIHSSTTGVRVDVLGPDGAGSRYWWDRWVGARRLVPEA
jgi:cell wall-associated NlpC family hydrolase